MATMKALLSIATAALLVLPAVRAFPLTPGGVGKRQADTTINWYPCPARLDIPPPFQCADFLVPRDYANLSQGNFILAVIGYPAQVLPRRGTVYANPDEYMNVLPPLSIDICDILRGPGSSGVNFAKNAAAGIQQQIGGDWDIISWDPRGVGYSEPRLRYFTEDESTEFWRATESAGSFEAHGNLTTLEDIDSFMSQAPIMDERLKAMNDLFIERNGANLTYIGTAAVVRDLVSIANAYDGPGSDINFIGYSYGTAIGMWLTQMFPDRVGKVVLDGVVDPLDYSLYLPYLGWDMDTADTPQTYKGFTEACALAGPTGCPLALQSTDTAATIDARINTILNTVHAQWDPATQAYSFADVTEVILRFMYNPTRWLDLALFLADFLNTSTPNPKRNSTRTEPFANPYPGHILGGGGRSSWSGTDYNLLAIFCGDAVDSTHITTEQVFREIVRVASTHSAMFATVFNPRFGCHRWTSQAVEKYTGPFNKTPKNVVLVIGNESDPITPFRSAKLVASRELLGDNARLVQQADFGHTSGAERSPCTSDVMLAFFAGRLPLNGGNDEYDISCPVVQSLLGLPSDTQFSNVVSDNGDALTSGPTDPDLEANGGPGAGSSGLGNAQAGQNDASGGALQTRFGLMVGVFMTAPMALLF